MYSGKEQDEKPLQMFIYLNSGYKSVVSVCRHFEREEAGRSCTGVIPATVYFAGGWCG